MLRPQGRSGLSVGLCPAGGPSARRQSRKRNPKREAVSAPHSLQDVSLSRGNPLEACEQQSRDVSCCERRCLPRMSSRTESLRTLVAQKPRGSLSPRPRPSVFSGTCASVSSTGRTFALGHSAGAALRGFCSRFQMLAVARGAAVLGAPTWLQGRARRPVGK